MKRYSDTGFSIAFLSTKSALSFEMNDKINY